MYRVLGYISSEIDSKVKSQIMCFLVLDIATSRCIGNMTFRLMDIISCNLDPKVKVKGEKRVYVIMYHCLQSSLL